MATFTDCADELICATLSGSNGINIGALNGTPNKIVVSLTDPLYVSGSKVGIGTTTPSSLLHLQSTGPVQILVEADTDNVNESDNANILMKQDGGSVQAQIGMFEAENNLRLASSGSSNNVDVWFGAGNGTEKARIKSDGKVGIGVSSPPTKFSIIGGDTLAAGLSINNVDVHTIITNEAGTNAGKIQVKSLGSSTVVGSSNYILKLNPEGGNVGIGSTSPTHQLELSTDSAAKPSTNTWTISSDKRIKENIQPYSKGLETITKINPVTYDYNGKAGFQNIKNNIGVIAQDVLEILPESISTYKTLLNEGDEEKTELYNFNSHALTYILINSVKQLKEENDLLKSKLDEVLAKLENK
jgi:Chaperone of endosialidase